MGHDPWYHTCDAKRREGCFRPGGLKKINHSTGCEFVGVSRETKIFHKTSKDRHLMPEFLEGGDMIFRFHKTEGGITLGEVALDQVEIAHLIYAGLPHSEFSCNFFDNITKKMGEGFGKEIYPNFPICPSGMEEWTPDILVPFLIKCKRKLDKNKTSEVIGEVYLYDEETKKVINLAPGEEIPLADIIAWLKKGGFCEVVEQARLLTDD